MQWHNIVFSPNRRMQHDIAIDAAVVQTNCCTSCLKVSKFVYIFNKKNVALIAFSISVCIYISTYQFPRILRMRRLIHGMLVAA